MKVKSLSRARLLATPWTAAHQAPRSMGFSSQEYWSGLPLSASLKGLAGRPPPSPAWGVPLQLPSHTPFPARRGQSTWTRSSRSPGRSRTHLLDMMWFQLLCAENQGNLGTPTSCGLPPGLVSSPAESLDLAALTASAPPGWAGQAGLVVGGAQPRAWHSSLQLRCCLRVPSLVLSESHRAPHVLQPALQA